MPLEETLIFDYLDTKNHLARLKKRELALRNQIIKSFRFSEVEGTQNREVETHDGIANLKIGLKLTRKIDESSLEEAWSDFSFEERGLVTFKPSLDVSGYKKLCETGEIGALSEVVTEKPAQATLSVSFIED